MMDLNPLLTLELTVQEAQAISVAINSAWTEGSVKNPEFGMALVSAHNKLAQGAKNVDAYNDSQGNGDAPVTGTEKMREEITVDTEA
mgnify:FL=1